MMEPSQFYRIWNIWRYLAGKWDLAINFPGSPSSLPCTSKNSSAHGRETTPSSLSKGIWYRKKGWASLLNIQIKGGGKAALRILHRARKGAFAVLLQSPIGNIVVAKAATEQYCYFVLDKKYICLTHLFWSMSLFPGDSCRRQQQGRGGSNISCRSLAVRLLFHKVQGTAVLRY